MSIPAKMTCSSIEQVRTFRDDDVERDVHHAVLVQVDEGLVRSVSRSCRSHEAYGLRTKMNDKPLKILQGDTRISRG